MATFARQSKAIVWWTCG